MREVKEIIEKYEKLLPLEGSISYVEAEKRAGAFLTIMAKIANWKHMFADDKIRLLSLQSATYASELAKGKYKTMTENKVQAEASEEYQKSREALESIENDISYLKAYSDIFLNAHLFYRQMARGEGT
jgi:hypothetical protein